MSDRGRVFKAHFAIVDNVHHCQLNEHFTTSRRDEELLEHFILRLIGFCLFAYRHDLVLCESKQKPQIDIVAYDLHDDYELVIEVFNDNCDELTKIYNRAQSLYVITTIPINDELTSWQLAHNRAELIALEPGFVNALEAVLARSLHWDVCVEWDQLSITTAECYVSSQVLISWP
ncbi:YaeQ family protein [Pseudoalteromonas sp. T1lg22]|uniref:YaeQ family protein n=1 Tax=Pseudoalteromonas sp. T1lg22 TaxID=2077096 RepID=UPI000CF66C52|nr:YaeQ family protein [Pseudoalteromonas sp. T1lg22]